MKGIPYAFTREEGGDAGCRRGGGFGILRASDAFAGGRRASTHCGARSQTSPWQARIGDHAGYKIDSLSAEDLFALIIPGGWAPDKLRRHSEVKDLVCKMDEKGKIIGIICHGGLTAISAGIMKGRRATGSLGIKDDIINAGGTWADEAAFREGNLIWGRVVADIPDFCRELVQALTEELEEVV